MANHILLQKVRLTSSAASVTFANIPQSGYTDLKIIYSARSDSSVDDYLGIKYSFNSSTASFSTRQLYKNAGGTGSATYSSNNPSGYIQASLTTSNTFASGETIIPNYTGSQYKSFNTDSVVENNGSLSFASLLNGLWSNNSAISSITLTPASGNFVAYSSFSLYGVASTGTTPATAPKADGGNSITTDGTYWIHTFTSSGFFTPISSLTCDYLVVAGGGGGAAYGGGGGGGGGFRTGTGLSVSAQGYAIIVGAGGTGGAGGAANSGTKGADSVFSTITSTGGGRGTITPTDTVGGSGGSGGGAGGAATGGAGNTPSTSPSQGNNGGNGNGSGGIYGSGGGGGAGAAGGNGSTTVAGNGGNGSSNSYSGSSVTYAGGGGGGAYIPSTYATGGTGGGGNAGVNGGNNNGSNGTANLGGGGGGSNWQSSGSASGGNGGSGVIIIRYAV